MMHLWRSDLRQLKRILRDLAAEPDAHAAPTTDDSADRAGLEAWLVGILSSRGDVSRDDLDMLVSMADETQTVGAAKVYVARVHDVLAPHRALLEFLDSLDSQITEHCRSRAYSLTNAEVRGVYYRRWLITIPDRLGQVRLTHNGEVFSLSFPGGFSMGEIGYSREDAVEALGDALELLDDYADPATVLVTRRRRFRRTTPQLRFANGSVLQARSGRRVYPRDRIAD